MAIPRQERRSIRVLVDEFTDVKARGALSAPDVQKALRRAVEIGIDTLEENIDQSLRSVFSVLSCATMAAEGFEVSCVRFTLAIEASGAISLLSLANAALGSQAGIEFEIVRRDSRGG